MFTEGGLVDGCDELARDAADIGARPRDARASARAWRLWGSDVEPFADRPYESGSVSTCRGKAGARVPSEHGLSHSNALSLGGAVGAASDCMDWYAGSAREARLAFVQRVQGTAVRSCGGDDQKIRRLGRPPLGPCNSEDTSVPLGNGLVDW